MKVLVLGGTGFIGSVVARQLAHTNGVDVSVAARRPGPEVDIDFFAIDGCNPDALAYAVTDMDVVINCITGSGSVIRDNATALIDAARKNESRIKIVHMSSMTVYGGQQGTVNELTPVSNDGNWYGQAKIDAEQAISAYGTNGGRFTIIRIGCVYGPSSAMWVDRIGLLIRQGRLGDLGTLGDGWSNLVHVDDVARATALSATSRDTDNETFNLAAPDSPRWNHYFRDFSLAIDHTPVRYKTPLSMTLESRLIAPPLKIWERVAAKRLLPAPRIQCIPPSLLRLWSQHIKLDSKKIGDVAGLQWTPYTDGLANSTNYFKRAYGR